MNKHLISFLCTLGVVSIIMALPEDRREPFDPSKTLTEYAGDTIIGTTSRSHGDSSLLVGNYAETLAGLHLRHFRGLQIPVYPAWNGSWPNEAPESIDKMVFNTDRISPLVDWAVRNNHETLHHLMIGPNQYFPEYFWVNEYTAAELDQLLKRYITTLITANPGMDGWNITNELFVYPNSGKYRKDGPGKLDCVWMRMGFEADQSGLEGEARIHEEHPVVFRKALEYASIARGVLEIRETHVAEINHKSNAFYQLVRHLINSGVRVDAVGFHCHLRVDRNYDWDSVKKNIRRFKDLGLKVYITELDVSMGTQWEEGDPFPENYESLQVERFYGIVKASREAGVERIDFWGLSDRFHHTWLYGQKARLFDEEFKPRKTYQAVLKALYDTQ